ncbi:hypothetical protein Poly30_38850 [Planctomycetes bacterium Poly30]|uniref:Uncharacterized protein n=1 Tax=Saltatorellus ferox TaxID=2528018 RepID=A0A518EW86_9BACT|nr:hypothetical protein Poly30_38850 [Planctomycetes bacterium Poly30]
MILPTLTTALLALTAVQVETPEAPSAPETLDPSKPAVIESSDEPAATEYFLISAPPGEPGEESAAGNSPWESKSRRRGEEGEPIAAVALRVIERQGGAGAGAAEFLYEREIVFAEGGLRIRHTETGQGASRRLVWREFLPSASRTWVADWTAGERGAEVRSIGYGWNRPVHETVMSHLELELPVFGPLEILHGLRTGGLWCGDAGGVLGVIDPSSASIIEADRSVAPIGSEALVDLRRPDGTLLLGADFDLRTGAFTALRLSDREASSRRIERAEFDRLNRRWTVESRRPYDAMLALIPARR